MVPAAEPRSYYGRPVIKEPVWTWEVPVYLFTGGMAGASAALGLAARLGGNSELSKRAWCVSMAGIAASPPLLISDLGRPERFLNMLRVLKPTSPMSVGSWLLSATGGAVTLATAEELLGRVPRAGRAAALAAGLLGPVLSTYTGALLSSTAVPAWREARRELPFVFAGSSMASAGAAAAMLTPPEHAAPARRLAVGGVALQGLAIELMKRRLGELAQPYHEGAPAKLSNAARVCSAAGAAILAGPARGQAVRALGGALVMAGSMCERLVVFKAGFASARDPRYTVGPQRERLDDSRAQRGSLAGAP